MQTFPFSVSFQNRFRGYEVGSARATDRPQVNPLISKDLADIAESNGFNYDPANVETGHSEDQRSTRLLNQRPGGE
jgi:hypothetical protein